MKNSTSANKSLFQKRDQFLIDIKKKERKEILQNYRKFKLQGLNFEEPHVYVKFN